MQSLAVSSQNEVILTRDILAPLNLKPGDRMFVVNTRGRLELIPEMDMKTLRGRYPGIDTTVERKDEWT